MFNYRSMPGSASDPAHAFLDHAHVRDAVAHLPDRHRSAVHLRFWRGLSYAEISLEMGVPLGTVSTLLMRARERLRVTLKDLAP